MITKISFHLKLLIIFFLVIVISIHLIKISLINRYQDKIFPHIYFNNLYLGEKNKDQGERLINLLNNKLNQQEIFIFFKDQPIATFSGEQLNLHYDKEKIFKKAYLIGREKNLVQRLSHLIDIFLFRKKIVIKEKIKYNYQTTADFIHYLENLYNEPAKNALFKFENGKVIAFEKEKNGLQILSDKFFSDLEKAVQDNLKVKKIVIKTKTIFPEITLAKANNFGIEEKIASGSSNFSGSISERTFNINLASSKFNGVLIPPGKIFSFNETLGEVSTISGYKKAYVIKEGKTILDDGGGVCQVSTTLFRAVLNAGLPVIERTAHAYRVHYYENDSQPGLDATVYAPYVDFKFKNDTPAYILIEREIDNENNLLFFNLYGKKDGRKVFISPVTIWDIVPPPETKYQEDPTLKKGIVKQVEWPSWGAKTRFNYQVINKGKVILEKVFYSYYQPWPAVFLVGTAD